MARSILLTLALILAPLLLDYYVFRNWRRFVRMRRSRLRQNPSSDRRMPHLGWTLPVYRVLMVVMPLGLPLYFYFSNWWTVEPKLMRAVFFGVLAIYYVPKAVLALALLVKDGARFVYWLFEWFREQLAPTAAPAPTAAEAPPLDLTDIKRVDRRAFLREVGWGAASVPFVLVGYSVFRTLYDYEVHRVDVPVAGLPRQLDGLTIAQLSDLHAGSFFSPKPMDEAVSIVQSLQPDVIAVTGDFVNNSAAELPMILPALRHLHADLGVYGCLGNHDHYARVGDVAEGIHSTAVDLLINEHRTLEIDGARLHLLGVDNTGFHQHFGDFDATLDGLQARPGDEARVLLAHTPTYWDEVVRPEYPDIDLMLCGHTHGGQIGFEMGPLRYSLARVAYPRWAGLYTEDRPDGRPHHLYVNRGAGTVGPPLRLGIRPEITLLTLRRA